MRPSKSRALQELALGLFVGHKAAFLPIAFGGLEVGGFAFRQGLVIRGSALECCCYRIGCLLAKKLEIAQGCMGLGLREAFDELVESFLRRHTVSLPHWVAGSKGGCRVALPLGVMLERLEIGLQRQGLVRCGSISVIKRR